MKKLLASLAIAAFLLPVMGCKNESPKGGPGAAGTAVTTHKSAYGGGTVQTTKIETIDAKDNSFTIKVPSGSTDVTQGKNKDVTISIDRGSAFTQDVKLSFKAPEGIKITPADATIASANKDTKVLIEAAADAVPGEKTIEVTGTPTTGKPTSVTFVVKVEKAG
jgi:uncharacterized membrane protein